MINRIKRYVEEQHMFMEGDYVVAGVSGGADSICLLCVLTELRRSIPMTIHVVHVNHGIRQEAGEDAAYVEQFCRERGIPFTLVEAKVEELAEQRHISTEEAGREVRYEAFYRILEQNKGNSRGRIAVAHNRNDCCETFLFHLFRGSGLKGLTGIPAVRDEIVRPLLCMERSEIENYLQTKGIHYCIDRTNLEDNYTRNRIRHHILQTASEEICENSTAHIKEACDRIGEAYDLIGDMTVQAYDTCVRKDDKGLHILSEAYGKLHKTIQGYVMMKALSSSAGSSRDLEAVHVEEVRNLMKKQVGRKIDLPYGLEAVREYQGVRIRVKDQSAEEETISEYGEIGSRERVRLEQGDTVFIDTGEGRFECRLINAEEITEKEIPSKIYTKWFDYDTIKSNVVVRNRRAGDYLTFGADHRRKTLKAYFIDEKVPREDRSHVYLVTEDRHCLWVVGGRMSSWYQVSGKTKYILEMKYIRRNQENG